ncbi:MAG TPA: hypothetical protein VEO36_09215, partial [Casimicrobiaceae bacterium]|nr:hypothetical protein [Casimicrobiaceae bacterium]
LPDQRKPNERVGADVCIGPSDILGGKGIHECAVRLTVRSFAISRAIVAPFPEGSCKDYPRKFFVESVICDEIQRTTVGKGRLNLLRQQTRSP